MRVLPDTREHWLAAALLPFKAYVVTALPCAMLFPQGGTLMTLASGYVLCLPVLLLGAIAQLLMNDRTASVRTALFVGVPFALFLMSYAYGHR